LFFIILSTGTNNEQPSLRLCEGFWTVYKPNILGKPNKGLGAIWNDKVWDIYTHEGIIQAKKIDLGNLRLLESYPELVFWQIVINENDFEVVIRNDKECAVWTKREDFKKEKEENEQAQVLKNVKKEKKENEAANQAEGESTPMKKSKKNKKEHKEEEDEDVEVVEKNKKKKDKKAAKEEEEDEAASPMKRKKAKSEAGSRAGSPMKKKKRTEE
jgi:primosomal protein N'